MRRSALLLPIVCLFSAAASAQIGKFVPIPAGSPEDAAFKEIAAAPTNAQKLALLDKFMAEYGKGDMAILAYEQYVAIYAADKNYDKAFEYGERALTADPDHFSIALQLFTAAKEKGDVERQFQYGETLAGIVSRFKGQSAPAGSDAGEWEARKKQTLASVADTVSYVAGTLFEAARTISDPKRQVALLEPYSIVFADSPYAEPAQTLVASSYRQMQDFAKMNEYSQKVLAQDPANINMLIIVADDASERGVNLAKADEYARRALDLAAKAVKPAGLSAEEWQTRLSLQQGLAWSAIGQVAIRQNKDAQALEAFRKAAPLLKSEPFSYARNAYRMGFALLNLKREAEARSAFQEAASVDTPYKPLAEQKLQSLPAGKPAKKRP
jgi:tetratricopeptide (TPR) repeat protein